MGTAISPRTQPSQLAFQHNGYRAQCEPSLARRRAAAAAAAAAVVRHQLIQPYTSTGTKDAAAPAEAAATAAAAAAAATSIAFSSSRAGDAPRFDLRQCPHNLAGDCRPA